MRLKRLLVTLNRQTPNLTIVKFPIPIPNQNQKHTKHECEVDITENFQKARQHIFSSNPRRTNHDLLQLMLFAEVLAGVQKQSVKVIEFGTWRGAFTENLAITARELDIKVFYTGFDTFTTFPNAPNSAEARTIRDLDKKIVSNSPFSEAELLILLSPYSNNLEVSFIPGDIRETSSHLKDFQADIVFFDMDYGFAFDAVVEKLIIGEDTLFIVDDYYQPSWFNLTLHVNKFCSENGFIPVNISDFFGVPRSQRTQFTAILIRKNSSKYRPLIDFRVN